MSTLQKIFSEIREIHPSEFDQASGGDDPQGPRLVETPTSYPTEYAGYYDSNGNYHYFVMTDYRFDQMDAV